MTDAIPPDSQHYRTMKIDPLCYIEANGIGFHEGNIIKYVSRWQRKDGIADLKKARFYIDRLIEIAEQAEVPPEHPICICTIDGGELTKRMADKGIIP